MESGDDLSQDDRVFRGSIGGAVASVRGFRQIPPDVVRRMAGAPAIPIDLLWPDGFRQRLYPSYDRFLPVGQIGEKRVQPCLQKYFRSRITQLKFISRAVSSH